MELYTLIGFFAAGGTTLAFVPQVVRIWKLKETKDISLFMYIIFSIGVFFWLIYGIMLKEYPVIIANGLTFVLAMTVLVMKLKYK